mgnify:CR=1 FL=1
MIFINYNLLNSIVNSNNALLKDSNNIDYNGRIMSLNKWAKEITGWRAIQTYAFIKQVGSKQTLSELREEKMRELGMID